MHNLSYWNRPNEVKKAKKKRRRRRRCRRPTTAKILLSNENISTRLI